MTELATLETEGQGDVVIARVSGELDISNAESTGDAIASSVTAEARGLVVDFSSLDFLDSSGISMLFRLARELDEHRQILRVVAPGGAAVARVLEIVDFQRAAPIDATVEEAVAGVQSGKSGD
jgi:anti-sigma B factor antagonist